MVVAISLRALLPKISYFRIPWTQTFCALLFSVYLCEKIILREWVSVRWLSWCQLVQYVLWLFFLKTWAEIESADQLYSVEEGVRSENRIRQETISEPHRALKGSSMSPHRSSSRAMDLLRNHTAKLLQKTHDWAFFPIPESSVPWIRVKAECNAKICIVLSIAEAHPRIAVCRTAKRAFGFLPKAKACLRE